MNIKIGQLSKFCKLFFAIFAVCLLSCRRSDISRVLQGEWRLSAIDDGGRYFAIDDYLDLMADVKPDIDSYVCLKDCDIRLENGNGILMSCCDEFPGIGIIESIEYEIGDDGNVMVFVFGFKYADGTEGVRRHIGYIDNSTGQLIIEVENPADINSAVYFVKNEK